MADTTNPTMPDGAVFVELHDGAPHSVVVLETRESHGKTYRSFATHDVDNCGTAADLDLWHHESGGGGGGSVTLDRFCGRWRRGFTPAEVWWDGVDVYAPRPLIGWLRYTLPRWLGADFRRCPRGRILSWWQERAFPRWLRVGRATRFSLWRLGYRRIAELPEWMPRESPFYEMCEGETVWCDVCEERFPDERAYEALPNAEGYDIAKAAADWLSARLLLEALDSWGDENARTWDAPRPDWLPAVEDACEDRLEALARQEAERDLGHRPAGFNHVRYEKLVKLRKSFPGAVEGAIRSRAYDLEARASLETVAHVCPHVWWDGEVGDWVGPGADE